MEVDPYLPPQFRYPGPYGVERFECRASGPRSQRHPRDSALCESGGPDGWKNPAAAVLREKKGSFAPLRMTDVAQDDGRGSG